MREIIFRGKMPDPFLKSDGTRMTKEEWFEKKDEIRQKIVDFEYGGMPPRPEFVEFEEMNNEPIPGRCAMWYKVKAGKPDKYVTFNLQIITNNKGKDKYVRVKVDTEDYRRRRKETLENLAKGIAYKVKKTRRPVVLEPMNPYERRIIHSALQGSKYVETVSEGEEPYRHIVVKLKRY